MARMPTAAWFVLAGGAAVAAHAVTAARSADHPALLGEAQLAADVVREPGTGLAADHLPLPEQFAALQLAVLELLAPLGDVSIVDAARWACLALGAAGALLMWPALRGLGVSAPAAAVAVAVAGGSVPALGLHAGVSAAAPAAMWLTLAAALAVHRRGRTAVLAAVLAVLTAPLALAALLALLAHVVFDGTVRPTVRWRVPLGLGLGLAAVGVAVVAVGSGPLAGTAGPEIAPSAAVAGSAVGLLVVVVAARSADWLRPVLTGAALLLVAGLVPGPARASAFLLAVPALAAATAVLVEQAWGRRRTDVPVALLMVFLLVPAVVVVGLRPVAPPHGAALLDWLATEAAPGVVVRADALDRAELLAAGFPVQRLRAVSSASDPARPGELDLVADRPTGELRAGPPPPRCPDSAVLASTARGTGGAPATVCRTDGGGSGVRAERAARIRLGAALAGNPALQLAPRAAAALREGAVDPRVMLVLAAMTSAHEIAVTDFPAVELDAPDVPRRRAVLAAVDGADAGASALLRTWLDAQQAPFAPGLVRASGPGLLIGYPVPPPGGLLPGGPP